MKHIFNILSKFLFAFVLTGMVLTGCDKDDEPSPNKPDEVTKPEKPSENPDDDSSEEVHGAWKKVTFKFREGHTHGSVFHGTPDLPGVKYLVAEQKLSFEKDENGKTKKSHDNPIRFEPGKWYALEIIYYNEKGKRINKDFTTPEMAPIHQHFFIPNNVKDIGTGKIISDKDSILKLLKYRYRDTDPEDYVRKNMFGPGKLRKSNDPIGLKGYFYSAKELTSFDLTVTLAHITRGTKLDEKGKPYPFNAPHPRLLTAIDLKVKIPIRVFTNYGMNGMYDEDQYIKDVAKEWGITEEEAEKDYDRRISSDVKPESSGYYL